MGPPSATGALGRHPTPPGPFVTRRISYVLDAEGTTWKEWLRRGTHRVSPSLLFNKKGRSEERPWSAGSGKKDRAPGERHAFFVLSGSFLQHLHCAPCLGNLRCGFTGWAVVDGKSGLVLPRAHEDRAACETGRGLCVLHPPHLLRGPGPIEGVNSRERRFSAGVHLLDHARGARSRRVPTSFHRENPRRLLPVNLVLPDPLSRGGTSESRFTRLGDSGR